MPTVSSILLFVLTQLGVAAAVCILGILVGAPPALREQRARLRCSVFCGVSGAALTSTAYVLALLSSCRSFERADDLCGTMASMAPWPLVAAYLFGFAAGGGLGWRVGHADTPQEVLRSGSPRQ
jgi:uncharacterized membrane protein YedE/YeeE